MVVYRLLTSIINYYFLLIYRITSIFCSPFIINCSVCLSVCLFFILSAIFFAIFTRFSLFLIDLFYIMLSCCSFRPLFFKKFDSTRLRHSMHRHYLLPPPLKSSLLFVPLPPLRLNIDICSQRHVRTAPFPALSLTRNNSAKPYHRDVMELAMRRNPWEFWSPSEWAYCSCPIFA